MAVILGLLAALAFGSSDFVAGVGGRRADAVAITGIAQPFGLLAALVGVVVLRKGSPTPAVLEWGAISGVGSGLGTVALYWGLSTGAMNVVSPLAAVISAVLPALVGVALGERLSSLAAVGIALSVPALVMVSLTGRREDASGRSTAPIIAGVVAGGGFALLFIALDRAGTTASAWPLIPGQAVAIIIVTVFVLAHRPPRATWPASLRWGVAVGPLSGVANLLYLAAAGQGQLAIVAVLTALYPAITVGLAAALLHEPMSRLQAIGLVIAAVSVTMISI